MSHSRQSGQHLLVLVVPLPYKFATTEDFKLALTHIAFLFYHNVSG